MSRDLLDLVRELNTLNDDNLADRVIANSDVQWRKRHQKEMPLF